MNRVVDVIDLGPARLVRSRSRMRFGSARSNPELRRPGPRQVTNVRAKSPIGQGAPRYDLFHFNWVAPPPIMTGKKPPLFPSLF